MDMQTTQLSNLEEGTYFRTSQSGNFYCLQGYYKPTRKMNVTTSNGDIFQMRPKKKVFAYPEWHSDARRVASLREQYFRIREVQKERLVA